MINNNQKSTEQRLTEQLEQAKQEHESILAEFKKTKSKASLDVTNKSNEKINALKDILDFEIKTKAKYRKEFQGKLIDEDFDDLWENSLRHLVLLNLATNTDAKLEMVKTVRGRMSNWID